MLRSKSLLALQGVGIALFLLQGYLSAVETIPNRQGLRLNPVDGREYPPVITAIAVCDDGKTIAAAGDDHAIRLLDGKNFRNQRIIGRHSDWVRSLDFSPDGTTLLSCGNDGVIQVWKSSANWQNPRELDGGPALACVRFSAKGDQVAAVGFASDIFLMSIQGSSSLKMTCDCRDLRTARFAAGGNTLVAGGRTGQLHFFDLNTQEELAAVSLHVGRLRDSDLLAGTNKIATVGEDGVCTIVDVQTRTKLASVRIPQCKLLSVAAIDASHVAVGGSDNLIRIIDTEVGAVTKRLIGHQGSVAVLKATNDHLISGSFDTSIRFWNLSELTDSEVVAARNAENIGLPNLDLSDR